MDLAGGSVNITWMLQLKIPYYLEILRVHSTIRWSESLEADTSMYLCICLALCFGDTGYFGNVDRYRL